MKKKTCRIGILLGMAVVLFCGALRQGSRNTYDVKASLNNIKAATKSTEKLSEILASNTEELETKILETEVAEEEKEKTAEVLSTCYGLYRVKDFYFYPGKTRQLFEIRRLEADLVLGRIISIQPDQLLTYDMGEREFVNYIIKRYVIDEPQYNWTDREQMGTVFDLSFEREVFSTIGKGYFGQLEGVITVSMPDISDHAEQSYYVLENRNEMIMSSNEMLGGVFLLERCEEEAEESLPEWTSQERQKLLQGVYGEYRIAEFLPTKYYPAYFFDGSSYMILPEEEARLMIGKGITISEDMFVTYDNYRQPVPYEAKRLEDDFWVAKVEIEEPDYRVKSVRANEIFGIRDGMLTGDLAQQEYVEIDVYPGYETNREWNLSQMYLTNDGRIFLYAMGEYFLLEKVDSQDGTVQEDHVDLSAWVGRYTGSSTVSVWAGNLPGGTPDSYGTVIQPREYEIEIHENDSGGYDADITVDSDTWEESVKIRADIYGNSERISFVFKEYVEGELTLSDKNGDVLLSLRKDADTGSIYTYWGSFAKDKYPEGVEEICFIKE